MITNAATRMPLHPRDLQLIVSLLVVSAIALATAWFGASRFERELLAVGAEAEAVRWATHLESNFSNLDDVLNRGILTPADEAALDFVQQVGGVFRYKLFNAKGEIVIASRPQDIGLTNTKSYFVEIVRKGETFVRIERQENFGPAHRVVSEAYVPFLIENAFRGAIEVYVDTSAQAALIQNLTTKAQFFLVIFLAVAGILCGSFIARNIRARNTDLAQLTERTKQLQQAQTELLRAERLATLGQVTATVSHELRNPLGVVRNAIFLVANKVRDDKALTLTLERADRNIARCNRIITELLDFTREPELVAQATLLDSWLETAVEEFDTPAGVTVAYDFEARDTLELSFDRERIRRAILNIFDNACQAMVGNPAAPVGAGVLTIRTRIEPARAIIEFADNGEGMDAATSAKIFEPLFSTKNFGVGLGLPTVKQIIDLHGGGIDIDSTPGHGTVVRFWLPRQPPGTGAAS